jgi:hypothetical protein
VKKRSVKIHLLAPCARQAEIKKENKKYGTVLNAEPEGILGYTSVPFKDWFNDLPYA